MREMDTTLIKIACHEMRPKGVSPIYKADGGICLHAPVIARRKRGREREKSVAKFGMTTSFVSLRRNGSGKNPDS